MLTLNQGLEIVVLYKGKSVRGAELGGEGGRERNWKIA